MSSAGASSPGLSGLEGYASASAPRHTSRDRARVSPDSPSRLLPSICGHRRQRKSLRIQDTRPASPSSASRTPPLAATPDPQPALDPVPQSEAEGGEHPQLRPGPSAPRENHAQLRAKSRGRSAEREEHPGQFRHFKNRIGSSTRWVKEFPKPVRGEKFLLLTLLVCLVAGARR